MESGLGWRTVYVKTNDIFNRTMTASDTIYLGANFPINELGSVQMSSTQSQATIYNLNSGGLPLVQFSAGWLADDTFGTFEKHWGNGERVNDTAAWGGIAYRLYPGDGESFAWVYDTTFIKDTPLIAYFRLKVNNNTSTSEVARISVKGGGTEYGPLSLRGADFSSPNQYQEFPVSFTFSSNPDDPFLIFQFWRSGSADVYVDAVSIFSTPQAVASPFTWNVPGGNYRGQGIWVRYTNGSSQFSAISEANTSPPDLAVSPNLLAFLAAQDGNPPPSSTLTVSFGCSPLSWQVSDDAPWLSTQVANNTVVVSTNHVGLSNGEYFGTITVSAKDVSGVTPATTQVKLVVVNHLYLMYLPLVDK